MFARSQLNTHAENLAARDSQRVNYGEVELVLIENDADNPIEGLCTEFSQLNCRVNIDSNPTPNSGPEFSMITISISARGSVPEIDELLGALGHSTERWVLQSWSLRREGETDVAVDADLQAVGLTEAQLASLSSAVIADNHYVGGTSMSSRNPFDPNHGPYLPPQVAPPPPAPIEVEVLGITAISGAPVALLLLNGQEIEVRPGDDTIAGRVVLITSEFVELGGEQARRVSLFD